MGSGSVRVRVRVSVRPGEVRLETGGIWHLGSLGHRDAVATRKPAHSIFPSASVGASIGCRFAHAISS